MKKAFEKWRKIMDESFVKGMGIKLSIGTMALIELAWNTAWQTAQLPNRAGLRAKKKGLNSPESMVLTRPMVQPDAAYALYFP